MKLLKGVIKLTNMTTTINVKGIPFDVRLQPSKELESALKELDYMENHPEEYKVYYDVDKMFEDILDEK